MYTVKSQIYQGLTKKINQLKYVRKITENVRVN